MSARLALSVVAALVGLLLLAGCTSTAVPPSVDLAAPPSADAADLPTLLAAAHLAYSPYGPVLSVERSLATAEDVLAAAPANELAAFLAARAALWLLEFGNLADNQQAHELARRGREHARVALAAGPDRADRVFLEGALAGQELRYAAVPGLIKLNHVAEAFARAVELDPSYDGGAPLRALGTLKVRAPQWPSGIGDAEEGVELLTRATALRPGHPANHLYLGEALVEEGRLGEARLAFESVVEICHEARWGAVCDTYRPRAENGLDSLAR